MKRTVRRIGLAASLSATMALAGAGPALAQGQGPKVVTGNPGKGATVIHCKRLAPGANGVIVITPKGKVNNNCKGLPAELSGPLPTQLRELLEALPADVRELLPPVLQLPPL